MIGTLIKLNIRQLFAGIFRRYTRGKKPKPVIVVLVALLVLYVFAALFFTVGMMFYNLCGTFFELGIGWFYFSLAGLMIFALCFIGSFFMVQTQLFAAKDNELLLSMPIKPSAILAGRLAALLVFEYLFEAIIIIPVFAVLIITGYISYLPVMGIVLFLLSGLLLPLFALAVGCLFGWIVAVITSRMRRKNILTFVMTLLFLAAYFWLYTKMTTYMNVLIERGVEIAEAVRRAIFPAYHLGLAAADGSLLSFLIFAICAVAPFIIMCALLSYSFIKVTTSNRGAKKVVYREKKLRATSVSRALMNKELHRFFSTPMYILNASMGSIFTLVIAGFLLVRPGIITDMLADLSAIAPSITPGILGVLTLTMLAGMNMISAPTVSLEGNKLWIIKSLPVPAWYVLWSKLMPHQIVSGITSILTGLVCIFRLPGVNYYEALLLFIAPQAMTMLSSYLGLTLNLIFPRFDWLNEMQPIKQGASGMLTMFGMMATVTALVLLYVLLLHSFLKVQLYIALCIVLFTLVSLLLYLWLKKAGVRRFESLDA